ncbi:copper homeostasis protein [Trypanosoma conorhini]|uniref:Copper homeostasis protein cutC homolog n=1 Tax=Trypanosoma conorhini TaxID=83891 RepID=A0A3R7KZ23_9TRYP|nr:copper homeostasis protein [Trypanosoma conorhini]RNF04220.1 copper homeostasis protein [Trypanosoma conorhini]
MVLKEFCAEGYERIPDAVAAGAQRVELCARLDVGGVTPSAETIHKTVEYCHARNVLVMVIIRCRGGNFYYSDEEFQVMRESVLLAKCSGADGVVVGAIDALGNVDPRIGILVSAAEGLSLTFHMAFDEIPAEKQFQAIDVLTTYGFHRILTHGGPAGTSIEQNMHRLTELVAYAKNRISIMPGGGVTTSNADRIVRDLGVTEVHGTRIVRFLQSIT